MRRDLRWATRLAGSGPSPGGIFVLVAHPKTLASPPRPVVAASCNGGPLTAGLGRLAAGATLSIRIFLLVPVSRRATGAVRAIPSPHASPHAPPLPFLSNCAYESGDGRRPRVYIMYLMIQE